MLNKKHYLTGRILPNDLPSVELWPVFGQTPPNKHGYTEDIEILEGELLDRNLEVTKRTLHIRDEHLYGIPNWVAATDPETGYVFDIIKVKEAEESLYFTLLNKKWNFEYEMDNLEPQPFLVSHQKLMEITQDLLKFSSFHVGMPRHVYTSIVSEDGSSILATLVAETPFYICDDRWYSCIGVQNSYKKDIPPVISIGFCCFDDRGVHWWHSSLRYELKRGSKKKDLLPFKDFKKHTIKKMSYIKDSMEKEYNQLKKIPYSETESISLIMRLPNAKRGGGDRIQQLVREYFNKHGNNRYSTLQALTAYASQPVGYEYNPARVVSIQQNNLQQLIPLLFEGG